MAKVSTLRNLRKTTIIVVAVFFGFLVHRLVAFCMEDVSIQSTPDAELTLAQSVICSHIVNGSPFGVDSVFEEGTRLYYYSTLSSSVKYGSDTLMHIWYNGADTVQKSICDVSAGVCHTTIVPALLKPGEWSVDLAAGRKLLSTQQFVVEPVRR
ncbi:MAG: hypothetical protein MJY98_12060 [Fibrobacter sp.]|nr:hypothetical protein [Fibrobacter sp.]